MYKPEKVTYIKNYGALSKIKICSSKYKGHAIYVFTETLVLKEIAESSLFKIMNEMEEK